MSLHKTTVLLLLMFAATVYADDEVAQFDFCRDVSLIAKEVMTARQQDRPMSETLLIAIDRFKDLKDKNGLEMDEEEAKEFGAGMVMTAYEAMIFPVKKYKQQKATEFENAIFKQCYEKMTTKSDE